MRTLAAIALLFSAQAFACPTLTGTYTCKYQDGNTEQMVISQDVKGTVVTYNLNGSDIPADNVVRPMPDSDNIKNGTFRAWCDDDVNFKAQIIGKYWNQGQYYGDLTLNIDFAMQGSDLKQDTNGQIVNSGGTMPISQQTVCTKN